MLVVIEGIDGSGKHTQAQRLQERLTAEGYRVAPLAFPRYGQTLMARAVADYLNGHYGPIAASPPLFPALLFAGDRFESRDLIVGHLEAADVLLIDRYTPSNMAHQAAKMPPAERPAFIDWVAQLEYDVYALPRPDVTLFLDVPTDTASALILKKQPRDYTDAEADLHERDRAYLQASRDAYALVAQTPHGGHWHTIACTDDDGAIHPIDTIHAALWSVLSPHLPPR